MGDDKVVYYLSIWAHKAEKLRYLTQLKWGIKMRRALLASVILCPTFCLINFYGASAAPRQGDDSLTLSGQAGSLDSQRNYAQEMYRSEKFDEAASRLKSLVDAGSNQACDHYWLGESYYHLGKYVYAAAAFRQAIALDPAMDNAKVRWVEACLASRDFSRAQSACSEVISTVADFYSKKKLEVLSRVASQKFPPGLVLKLSGTTEGFNSSRK